MKRARAISLARIPGYREALQAAAEQEFKTREDNFLAFDTVISGEVVRCLPLRDYVALTRCKSPFLFRREPTHFDLEHFLWTLSPVTEKWNDSEGWRKIKWFPTFYQFEKEKHRRRVRLAFQLRELEKTLVTNESETDQPYVLPESHPLSIAFEAAFDYIAKMFFDLPSAGGGPESGLSYLTAWFDILQSEYKMPSEEIWRMPIPQLLSRLKAIQQRRNPKIPDFNARRDALNQQVQRALKDPITRAQLLKGEFKFQLN